MKIIDPLFIKLYSTTIEEGKGNFTLVKYAPKYKMLGVNTIGFFWATNLYSICLLVYERCLYEERITCAKVGQE